MTCKFILWTLDKKTKIFLLRGFTRCDSHVRATFLGLAASGKSSFPTPLKKYVLGFKSLAG